MALGSDSSGPPPLVSSRIGSSDDRNCGEDSGDSDGSDLETAVAFAVMMYLTYVHNGSVGVKASGSEGIGEKEKKTLPRLPRRKIQANITSNKGKQGKK